MPPSAPANPLAVGAIIVAYVLFLAAVLHAYRRRDVQAPEGGQRDRRSLFGIVLQGLAFGLASFGQVIIEPRPVDARMVIGALPATLLAFASVALFLSSSAAMGRNWAIVASTRADHRLVTDGPFAWIRNPIYLGMFAMMLALALALGHPRMLIAAVPLFAIGTAMRVRIEEGLLRAQFGAAYDAYAARVKRFVPGIF